MAISQDIRWLLKDKYAWPEAAIAQYFAGRKGAPPELKQDLERLKRGEPLQYVIGWVPFLGCQIDLSLRPLIPRPETEYWVEQVIGEIGREKAFQVLDLCCGSGCIGIAVLKQCSKLNVDFADVSPAAIQQTKLNVIKNNIKKERPHFFESNLFENIPLKQYDFILSNPPYVDPLGEFSGDLAFEPAQSLFAQNHGLDLIEQIIFQSKKYLKLGGKLVLEFGKGQEKAIERMMRKAEWQEYTFRKDQFDVVRWVETRKPRAITQSTFRHQN